MKLQRCDQKVLLSAPSCDNQKVLLSAPSCDDSKAELEATEVVINSRIAINRSLQLVSSSTAK